MRFDKIIMNPPFNGNLHLKILQEAMKHSDDVVNLSPIRWLQDPLAEYKKNSDFKKFEGIIKRIKDLEVVPASYAEKLFNIGLPFNLGIYHITEKGNWKNVSLLFSVSAFSASKSSIVARHPPLGISDIVLLPIVSALSPSSFACRSNSLAILKSLL